MDLFFSLLSGLFWIITYIQIIRVGFKDKTYGMPAFALALNFAWEAIYSYISLKSNPLDLQGWVIFIWFLLDIAIVFTYLKYGIRHFPIKKYFIPWTIIIFIMSFVIQYSFIIEFGELSSWYSAFIQNLIMSAAFINMLYIRRNVNGQNLRIAISKWIGTLAATVVFGIIYDNQLVLVLGIFCSIFDMIYIFYLRCTIKRSSSFSKPCIIRDLNI